MAHERRRAAGPEHHAGDAELSGHLQGEAHERRGQHTRDGRHVGRRATAAAAEPRDELPQRRRAPVGGGLGQAEVVVLLVAVGVHQPVRDGLDPERVVVATAHGALLGGGGLGAAEVVLGDDEGDEDAVVAQKQGQLQRRVDVAGARVGHHHDVRLRHRRRSCRLHARSVTGNLAWPPWLRSVLVLMPCHCAC